MKNKPKSIIYLQKEQGMHSFEQGWRIHIEKISILTNNLEQMHTQRGKRSICKRDINLKSG
jgi:hypothetical protein